MEATAMSQGRATMPKHVMILNNYDSARDALTRQIKQFLRTAGFESPAATLHALMEVASENAESSGFGFEDYMRATLCAWDCFHKRREACTISEPDQRTVN
jgi:hypothetical protein